MNQQRFSNIEFLRIIAMCIVILGHYYVKGKRQILLRLTRQQI